MASVSGEEADPVEQAHSTPQSEPAAMSDLSPNSNNPDQQVDESPDTAAPVRSSMLKVLLGSALLIIVVDQLTKWWVVATLDVGEKFDVFWKLRMNHVLNEGASFGKGQQFGPWIGVIAFGVGIALIFMGRRVSSWQVAVALGVILGGAWGNLLDRLFRESDSFLGGAVVDFVDTQVWPVWNVADMGVVCGGAALLVLAMRGNDELFA